MLSISAKYLFQMHHFNVQVCICNYHYTQLTLSVVSPRETVHVRVSASVVYKNSSAFVAARVSEGGCRVAGAQGVFFWIDTAGYWSVTTDLGTSLVKQICPSCIITCATKTGF